MNEPDNVLSALPPEVDDEPKSLRRDIIDELADHFACALERERPCSPDNETAWKNVVQKFGNPQAIALQLWRIAMAERIAKERFMIAAISLLLVTQLLFIGAFFYWITPKLTAADDLKSSNKEILLAVQELQKTVRAAEDASHKSNAAPQQSPNEKIATLRTEGETEFEGAYFRVVNIADNDVQDENDDSVSLIARKGSESDTIALEEFRLENVLNGEFTVVAEDIRPSSTPGEGRAKLRIISNQTSSVSAATASGTPNFFVVMADHVNIADADRMLIHLKEVTDARRFDHGDGTYSVRIGPLNSREEADMMRERISNEGFLVIAIREESTVQLKTTSSGTQSQSLDHPERPRDRALPAEIKAAVTHELPVTKDCMVLKYMPDWNYGNVDNIAVANNDGGVRTLIGWNAVEKELVEDQDNKFMLALFAREVTFQPDDSEMGVFPIAGEWPELTSWNQSPTIESDPVDTMKIDEQQGWKFFDVTQIVRGNAEQQGVCIRFLDETKTGWPATWSGFAFVSREGTAEWEGLEPRLLIINADPKEIAGEP